VGGGVLLVPSLIYLFKMTPHEAQGTTLALMVPPIGLLAAWTYYKDGFVDIRVAALICLGFFIGGLFGAKLAEHISDRLLEKIFGAFIFLISIKMMFFGK
jgi:uncharacterized membrane protein YfcA